jgi:hypothetical protein
MVMVSNLGVCSRLLTNNFVYTDVLVCGSNVTGVVVVSKSFVYLDCWQVLELWGRQICGGWLGDAW